MWPSPDLQADLVIHGLSILGFDYSLDVKWVKTAISKVEEHNFMHKRYKKGATFGILWLVFLMNGILANSEGNL
jgi:hypothetical protein